VGNWVPLVACAPVLWAREHWRTSRQWHPQNQIDSLPPVFAGRCDRCPRAPWYNARGLPSGVSPVAFPSSVLLLSDRPGTIFHRRDISMNLRTQAVLGAALCLLLGAWAGPAPAQEPTSQPATPFRMLRDVKRVVFKVKARGEDRTVSRVGTGFLIGENGLAVTNYHLIQNA